MNLVAFFMLTSHAVCVLYISACDPAELDNPYSLNFSFVPEVNKTVVTWGSGNDSKVIANCNITTLQCVVLATFFSATIIKATNNYSTTLYFKTILPDFDQYNYTFNTGQTTYNVCAPLQVFNRTSSPSCSSVLNMTTNSSVIVRCTSLSIFPSAQAIVSFLNYNTTFDCQKDTTIQPNNDICTTNIPISYMKPNINNITIKIFPKVIRGDRYSVETFSTINLTLPEVELSNCPMGSSVKDGYILNGTSASCLCVVTNRGYPSGYAQWYKVYPNNTLKECGLNYPNGSSFITVDMFQFGDFSNYTCKGKSFLKNENAGVVLLLEIAYGPKELSFNSTSLDSINPVVLCHVSKLNVTFTCSVPRKAVNPTPVISISNNFGFVEAEDSMQNTTEMYKYTAVYSFNRGGLFTFICDASNPIFESLKLASNTSVVIYEPPRHSPYLKIGERNYTGNFSWIAEPALEGSNVDVVCQSVGGFPEVYNMTLTCGENYTISSTGSTLTLSLGPVYRYISGKLCVCKAEHTSSCYWNNTSSIKLNVLYSAKIVQFTVNTNNSSVTVNKNTSVAFTCDADSNPPANITVYKTFNSKRLEILNIQASCEDTGEYVCEAKNDILGNIDRRLVFLYVLCPLQLKNEDTYNVTKAKLKSKLEINFEIFGYPTPKNYTLFKHNFGHLQEIINFTTLGKEGTAKYSLYFESFTLPYGYVTLTIYNVTSTDFMNYTLRLDNGLGIPLNYYFTVTEEVEKKVTSIYTEDFLAAAIGGTIAAVFFIAIIILVAVTSKKIRQQLQAQNYVQNIKLAEAEFQNRDIYFAKSNTENVNSECYKNYSDITTTITTASAMPLNLKGKPNIASKPGYTNYVGENFDDFIIHGQEKHNLICKDSREYAYENTVSEEHTDEEKIYANS